jgi:hypothetical protein
MGRGVGIECNNCNYKFTGFEGIGMFFFDLKNVMNSLPDFMQKEINLLIDEYDLSTSYTNSPKESGIFFEERIFVHPISGYMSVKLYVELYRPQNGELLYKTVYRTKAGKEYQIIKQETITDRPCPKCKNRSLEVTEIINWD